MGATILGSATLGSAMTLSALLASPWAWLALGGVLMGLELAAPGLFLVWFGLAALGTGLITLVAPLGPASALFLFAGLGFAAVLLARRLLGPSARREASGDLLGRRAEALRGRELTLSEAIADGEGRASADDVVWRVTGPALPAGARVRVTGAEGTRLVVEGV